jgi:hypothetical protein
LNDENSIVETVDLAGVSSIKVIGVDRDVHVIGSNKSRLEVRSLTGDMLTKLKYNISGDTLMLTGFQSEENKRVKISVFISNASLKVITINKASVVVEGLQQDYLHLLENGGRIWMRNNNISSIKMNASNQSFLNITGDSIDTVSANVEGSEIHIYAPIRILQGSLINKAFMQVTEVLEIQVKKDESSRLNMH